MIHEQFKDIGGAITKVVQFIPSTLLGGGEMMAVQLAIELKQLNPQLDVRVVSLFDPSPTPVYDQLKNSAVVFHSLGKKPGFDFSLVSKIRRLLKEIQPDIVHTHLGAFRYVSIACILLKGFKKIHTVHTIANRDVTIKPYWYTRYVFKRLSWYAVSLNQSVLRSLSDLGIDSVIISNGVRLDENALNCSKDKARALLGLSEHARIILSVGRLSEEKDQIALVNAFDKIAGHYSDLQLILVGSVERNCSYVNHVGDRIASLSSEVRSRISLRGEVSTVPLWIKAADLFVLSSRWEGMPLVLMEAMGYGLPIVSTDAGGIVDMLTDGKDALLVPTGSVELLSKTISCFFEEGEESRNRRVKSSLKKFVNSYSIRSTALSYFDLYRSA